MHPLKLSDGDNIYLGGSKNLAQSISLPETFALFIALIRICHKTINLILKQ